MSIRTERVASVILRDLSQLLADDFDGQMPTLATVTGVRMTGDLSIAHVYVSIMGETPAFRKAGVAKLTELAPQIRRSLAALIRHQVRIVPELRFHLDESLLEAQKMEALFDKIREERERGGPEETE